METESLIAECLGLKSLAGFSLRKASLPLDFKFYQLFSIHEDSRGAHRTFDFMSLPYGSYAYVAVCEHGAIRLRRRGRELETFLKHEWSSLKKADPVHVADFLLTFLNDGIKDQHAVIRDFEEIEQRNFESNNVNMEAVNSIKEKLGTTNKKMIGDQLVVRAISLRGWMHTKQELGAQTVTIATTGAVTVSTRQVLCSKIFKAIPQWIEF